MSVQFPESQPVEPPAPEAALPKVAKTDVQIEKIAVTSVCEGEPIKVLRPILSLEGNPHMAGMDAITASCLIKVVAEKSSSRVHQLAQYALNTKPAALAEQLVDALKLHGDDVKIKFWQQIATLNQEDAEVLRELAQKKEFEALGKRLPQREMSLVINAMIQNQEIAKQLRGQL